MTVAETLIADTLEGIAAVRDGQGQIRTGERIGDEDEREDRHDVAEGAAGALEDDDDEAGAREGRHPGRLAQTLGEVMDLVLRHPDGNPGEDDEDHIKRAAGGAEGLAAGEFILENVLVKGLGEQDQREGEAQMHAALHGVVEQAEKAGVNMEGGPEAIIMNLSPLPSSRVLAAASSLSSEATSISLISFLSDINASFLLSGGS